MATTVEPRTAPDAHAPRFVFDGVSWEDYEAMLRIVGDRPIRVTYDRGRLEIMSPSLGHEGFAYLLGRMVDALSEELDVPIEGGGTTTFLRRDLGKGAEPDQCYWFRDNAARVRGKDRLDLAVDPPPDLVIEVDITSSSLPRLAIFAAMGVPEVWRFDGETLEVLVLREGGAYRPVEASRSFPGLSAAEIAGFLARARAMDKTAWIKAFRAFVRDTLIPRGAGHPAV